MNQKAKVSVVRANDDKIENAVREAIDLVHGLEDLKEKKTIAIKPNLCGVKSSDSGQTTDPRIVEAIINMVNSIASDCKINIVETDNSQASADKTFRILGYKDLEKNHANVECVNLSKDTRVRMSLDGSFFKTILIPETMFFSDYFINVAKLKTHADYYYTGILKNAYGFLQPRSARMRYHGFMHKVLADLNGIFKPDLSIIDGIVGMEGFGPTDGNPKYVGIVVASKDPVAADSVAAQIAGFKPSRIKHLRYASKKGLGQYENIETIGCDLEMAKNPFKFIPMKWFYLGRLSMWIQRRSLGCSNLARCLSLARSSLATIGFSTLEKRSSIIELIRLAKDTIFKVYN